LPAPYPFGFIGDAITRGITLVLALPEVRALLPASLELGEQDVTPEGTHPVIFLFHGFSNCQFSIPTLLQSLNFHEQTVGIPFTYVRAGIGVPDTFGPYYFMPKLYLDDLWVSMIGRNFWGFDKELAKVDVAADRYAVSAGNGRQLASLTWSVPENDDDYLAAAMCPAFAATRRMLSQPLITQFPAAIGPFFVLTDFDRRWNLAKVRPLRTVLEVDPSYMSGFDGGCFVAGERSEDADSAAPAAYELVGPWWLSYPYQPLLSSPEF
jgi:hypothetical protein